jgi:hypothetical protein
MKFARDRREELAKVAREDNTEPHVPANGSKCDTPAKDSHSECVMPTKGDRYGHGMLAKGGAIELEKAPGVQATPNAADVGPPPPRDISPAPSSTLVDEVHHPVDRREQRLASLPASVTNGATILPHVAQRGSAIPDFQATVAQGADILTTLHESSRTLVRSLPFLRFIYDPVFQLSSPSRAKASQWGAGGTSALIPQAGC